MVAMRELDMMTDRDLAEAKRVYGEHRDTCNTCTSDELCDLGQPLWDTMRNLVETLDGWGS